MALAAARSGGAVPHKRSGKRSHCGAGRTGAAQSGMPRCGVGGGDNGGQMSFFASFRCGLS